jgi:hypothetical protein
MRTPAGADVVAEGVGEGMAAVYGNASLVGEDDALCTAARAEGPIIMGFGDGPSVDCSLRASARKRIYDTESLADEALCRICQLLDLLALSVSLVR